MMNDLNTDKENEDIIPQINIFTDDIVSMGEGRFAREGENIDTVGVANCKALICITSNKRRFLAHVKPNEYVSQYKPILEENERALYMVIDGPRSDLRTYTLNPIVEEEERQTIRDPRFIKYRLPIQWITEGTQLTNQSIDIVLAPNLMTYVYNR